MFGVFAGYEYWFPKAFGFRLHEGLGKAAFWFWIVGFYVAFMPLYVLGLMGMTRRMQHYDVPEWQPWLLVAAAGAALIAIGVALQVVQLVWSIRHREALRDVTGDPWNGRTLEWMTPSPPPMFNYAVMPNVEGVEAYWMRKQSAIERQALRPEPEYHDIHMPRNSSAGFICAFFAATMGFALIWHIWWLVVVAFVGAWAVFVVVAWRDEHEEAIPAATVARRRPGQSRRSRGRAADAEAGLVSAGADVYPGGVAGGGLARGGGHAAGAHRGAGARPVEAHRRRLRVLDLPDQRHHPVLRAVRDLRGADRCHRRRPERPRPVRAAHGRRRDRVPAALDRVLRLRRHRRAGTAQRHVLRLDGRDVRARRDLRRDRAARVRDA